MKPIRVLTIKHNGEDRRIRVILIHQHNPNSIARYAWIEEETGDDTEVGGLTVALAMKHAAMAWSSPYWQLRFGR